MIFLTFLLADVEGQTNRVKELENLDFRVIKKLGNGRNSILGSVDWKSRVKSERIGAEGSFDGWALEKVKNKFPLKGN